MGIVREKNTGSPTVEIKVLVNFMNGSEGDFKGTFKRLSQDRLDTLLDPDENFQNSELLDEILVGVSGICDKDPSTELPSDEQLAWVKDTPECVNAAVVAFFRHMRPARYDGKTSKPRHSRG